MMRLRQVIFFVIIVLIWQSSSAQTRVINIKSGENWYGGAVTEGQLMPFKDGYSFNLHANTGGNQAAPLLVSTKGRYIWSDTPFEFSVKGDQLIFSNPVEIDSTGHNLKEAFINAAKKHFPSQGKLPDTLLFSEPQYNTWIELVYNQNQIDIIKYANAIISNGFPAGVLMIDDNWA